MLNSTWNLQNRAQYRQQIKLPLQGCSFVLQKNSNKAILQLIYSKTNRERTRMKSLGQLQEIDSKIY